MTGFFIFTKDGNLYKDVPYKYKYDAAKILYIEQKSKLRPESVVIYGKNNISQEQIDSNCWKYVPKEDWWIFDYDFWHYTYLVPYVNNNFIIVQKEYELIFSD